MKPTEHHVTHERITREIHNHDVFHRILPVIDVEILPTKHYIVDPRHPGILKEIPESEAPARNNWSITTNLKLAPDGLAKPKDPSSNEALAAIRQCRHEGKDARQPVLTNKRSYMTEHGVMRTEYFWKHPPTLDMSLYNQGKTAPLLMNCMSLGDFSKQLATSQAKGPDNTALFSKDELERRAKVSLAGNQHMASQETAAATRRPIQANNQPQTQKIPHEHPEHAGAAEALAAAVAAVAEVEEVVAAAPKGSKDGEGAQIDDEIRPPRADARTSGNGISAVKDKHAQTTYLYGAKKRTSSDSERSSVASRQGSMRARLQKAKEAVVEIGQRVIQH